MASQREDQENLQTYMSTLRESILKTEEQIIKENNKAKEALFNIAVHFGFKELTREKIQDNFDKAEIVSDLSDLKLNKFAERNIRQKERSKRAKNEEEFRLMSDPKKRTKMTLNTDEYSERSRNK